MIKIIPAILEKNFLDIKDQVEKFATVATTIQIDVCDGEFVKSLTWLPTTQEDLNGLNINLEFDMMVYDIRKYLDVVYYYSPKKIIIHSNNINIADIMFLYDDIKEKNHFIQVAICDSDVEKIKAAYGYYDYVQLMGIENIGVQGQAFDMTVIQKIKDIKNFLQEKSEVEKVNNSSLLSLENFKKEIFVQIDGAMNPETIKLCKEAGASSFAVGSYFKNAIKNNKLKEVYVELKSI